jgi:hypothetical protein
MAAPNGDHSIASAAIRRANGMANVACNSRANATTVLASLGVTGKAEAFREGVVAIDIDSSLASAWWLVDHLTGS